MKKILVLMLMVVMIVTSASAESLDLDAQKESELTVLQPGLYTVGEDIAAGSYQVIAADFGETTIAYLFLYADRNAYDSWDYSVCEELSISERNVIGLPLDDGSLLEIVGLACAFSVSGFEEADYPQYEAPEGTLIPAGIYTVGDLIPAGSYQIYTATIKGCIISVYQSQDSRDADECDYEIYVRPSNPAQGSTYTFSEGYILTIDGDAIMKKQAAFTFD